MKTLLYDSNMRYRNSSYQTGFFFNISHLFGAILSFKIPFCFTLNYKEDTFS